MTLYYRTYSWGTTSPKITEEEVQFLNHLVDKKNWRIVQLPQMDIFKPNTLIQVKITIGST
jgi:hypothetical protein